MPRGPKYRAARPVLRSTAIFSYSVPIRQLAARLRPRGEILDQRVAAGDRSIELGARLNQIGHLLPHTAPFSPLPGEGTEVAFTRD